MPDRLLLRLRASPRLAMAFAVAHATAIAAVWLTPMPMAAALTASVIVLGSLVWTVRRHAFRQVKGSLVELDLREDCSVSARLCGEEGWGEYRVDGSSLVSPVLTVLNLRSESGWRSKTALITADSIDPELFRRLRVWLRWRCGQRADGGLPARTPVP